MTNELILSTPVNVLQEYWVIQTVQQLFKDLLLPLSQNTMVVTPTDKTETIFQESALISPAQELCGKQTSRTGVTLLPWNHIMMELLLTEITYLTYTLLRHGRIIGFGRN
jgi:hypothetical protein